MTDPDPPDAFLTGDPEAQRKAVLAAIERVLAMDNLLPPTLDRQGRELLRPCWVCGAYRTWSKGALRYHLRRWHPVEWEGPHPPGWSSPRGLGRDGMALLLGQKGIERIREELAKGGAPP